MSGTNQWYVVVDDASPKIDYRGEWAVQPNPNAWNTTLSVSNTTGASASFRFTGNYVAVYGAVLYDDVKNPPISTYSIDGKTPVVFIPDLLQNNSFTTFFVSPKLTDSEHTLEILLASDKAPIFLDSILFNATTVAQVTSAGLQPTIITTIIVAPPSDTASAKMASTNTDSVPVGPIVGGVVGGLALLISAILAFYFLYWKPKKSHWNYHVTAIGDFDDKLGYTSKPYGGVTPYQVTSSPQTERSESIATRSSRYSVDATDAHPSRSSSYPLPPGLGSTRPTSVASTSTHDVRFTSNQHVEGSSDGAAQVLPAASLTPGQRKALDAQSRARLLQHDLVMHTDSGYRFDSDSGSSITDSTVLDPDLPKELPPTYSER